MEQNHIIEHTFEIMVSPDELHIVTVYDMKLKHAILFLSIKYPEKKAIHTSTIHYTHEGIEF